MVERGLHPRDKLMVLFWPEGETRLAQSALRNTLARIKEALREVDEPLRMEGDRVGFNVSIASTLDLELITRATSDSAPAIFFYRARRRPRAVLSWMDFPCPMHRPSMSG